MGCVSPLAALQARAVAQQAGWLLQPACSMRSLPWNKSLRTRPQVGALLVFAEYDRNRKKEVAKQRREEAERSEIRRGAREEREVTGSTGTCTG